MSKATAPQQAPESTFPDPLESRGRLPVERETLRVLWANSGQDLVRGEIHRRIPRTVRPTPGRIGQLLAEFYEEGLLQRTRRRSQGSRQAAFYTLSEKGFKLCERLGFDQEARTPSPDTSSISEDWASHGTSSPSTAAILHARYPRFGPQIAKHQPLPRHKPGLVQLMTDCISSAIGPPRSDKLLARARKQLDRPLATQPPYVDYDYLGPVSSPPLPILISQRTQTCRQIGDIILSFGGPDADDAEVDTCVDLAMLFYDLALLDDS